MPPEEEKMTTPLLVETAEAPEGVDAATTVLEVLTPGGVVEGTIMPVGEEWDWEPVEEEWGGEDGLLEGVELGVVLGVMLTEGVVLPAVVVVVLVLAPPCRLARLTSLVAKWAFSE